MRKINAHLQDAPDGSPSQDRSMRCSYDQILRAQEPPFEIASRPKDGPALWKRRWRKHLFTVAEALLLIDLEAERDVGAKAAKTALAA